MTDAGAMTVLLVEDNEDSCVIIRTWLEHAGYAVVIERNAASGITRAAAILPDVILMDVSLPGTMDGWMAVRELKAIEATSRIPVIAFTAHAMAYAEQRARDVGVDGYIAKPAPLRRVLDEVERVLALRAHD